MSEKEKPTEILSPREKNLRDLFYLSFRYSQGFPPLQHLMFNWMISQGIIHIEDITSKPPSHISSLKIPKIHLKPEESELQNFSEMWGDVFFETQTVFPDKNVTEEYILKRMIERDKYFQHPDHPRATGRTSRSVIADSKFDQHSSFVRRFAMHGEEAGHPAYNDMFSGLKNKLGQLAENDFQHARGAKRQLLMLKNKWERNHPGHHFFDS